MERGHVSICGGGVVCFDAIVKPIPKISELKFLITDTNKIYIDMIWTKLLILKEFIQFMYSDLYKFRLAWQ